MSSIRSIASEYKDEIQDGIAYIALWKVGRSWNATTFYPELGDDGDQPIFNDPDDIEELKKISNEDPDAVLLNACYDNLGGTSDEEDCANVKTLADFLAYQYKRAQEDGRHDIVTLISSEELVPDQDQSQDQDSDLEEDAADDDQNHRLFIGGQSKDFLVSAILNFEKCFNGMREKVRNVNDRKTYVRAAQSCAYVTGVLSSWETMVTWINGNDDDPCFQTLEEVTDGYLSELEQHTQVLELMKKAYWDEEEG